MVALRGCGKIFCAHKYGAIAIECPRFVVYDFEAAPSSQPIKPVDGTPYAYALLAPLPIGEGEFPMDCVFQA